MTTLIRSALCGLALLVPGAISLRAADPAPLQKGHVLILDNERTLEGDIERVGDQYCIRREAGETWVMGTKILRLCKDVPEAYAYLRSHANLDDADERLRLAQWCYRHDLPAQALTDVRAAYDIRPEHGPTKWLLAKLQEPESAKTAQPGTKGNDPVEAPPSIDLNTESLAQFVSHVQPILMNACVSCHGASHAGQFKLVRVHDSSSGNRRALQQNMAAVVQQVSFDRPQTSTLLIKAVTAHGEMTQPSFKGRDAPAFRALDEWVERMVATHPQLRERGAKSTILASSRTDTPEKSVLGMEPVNPAPARAVAAKEEFGATHPAAPAANETTPVREVPVIAPVPGRTSPIDEFDPVQFNRQMHPEKKGS